MYSMVMPSLQSVLPFKGRIGDFFFIALNGSRLDWFVSRMYFLLEVKCLVKVHLSLPATLFFSSSQVSLLQLIGYAARNLQCLLYLS